MDSRGNYPNYPFSNGIRQANYSQSTTTGSSDQQRVVSTSRSNKKGTTGSFHGSRSPVPECITFEEELPPRSLTPPPDFMSDPDEERRRSAKRLLPPWGIGVHEGQAESSEPRRNISEPAIPGFAMEELGSYVYVHQTCLPAERSAVSGKDASYYQRPVTPPPRGVRELDQTCIHSDALSRPKRSVTPPPKIPSSSLGKTTPLHNPSNRKKLEQLLDKADYCALNAQNVDGQTPLHCFTKRGHVEYTITLLFMGKAVDVDAQDSEGDTPMHIAVKDNRTMIINILLAFGASVTIPNSRGKTPCDVASKDIKPFLMQFTVEIDPNIFGGVDKFYNLDEFINPIALMNARLDSLLHPQKIAAFVSCLDDELNSANDSFRSLDDFDEVVAIDKQRREVRRWKETNPLQVKPGIRVLFLDGGGIRGLIQITILKEMERITGRKITELFDWIVGTSIGAILGLCLVYGKDKSLESIRSLLMRMKSKVFNGILSVDSSTKCLEQFLKEEFGEDTRLCDNTSTKVMVCVVNKMGSNPTIQFFNNFMEDMSELTNVPVWYACRATSAAPMYFQSCGDYVDGGVMANNPSMAAWAEIQRYYVKKQELPPDISIAVSVGTGIYPDKNMGDIDIFGKTFFSFMKTVKHALHLIEMLRNALSQSEETARTFSAFCNRYKIPLFRFNPVLFEVVATGETNDEKLVNMMLYTRLYLQEEETWEEMARMVTLLTHLSQLHSARAQLP